MRKLSWFILGFVAGGLFLIASNASGWFVNHDEEATRQQRLKAAKVCEEKLEDDMAICTALSGIQFMICHDEVLNNYQTCLSKVLRRK